ncbi:MAG: DUF6263 family protein [Armatimonadota bacterium]
MRFPIKMASLLCVAMTAMPLAMSAQEAVQTPEARTYQIRLNVPVGSQHYVGVSIDGNVVSTVGENSMPFAMKMSTYNKTDYLSKDEANIYTVKTTVAYGKMLMNNQPMPMPSQNLKIGITMKMNEYGQPIEIVSMDKIDIPNMPKTMDLNSLMKQSGMTFFPKEPIKVGDSWDNEFAMPKSDGPAMKLTNTLEKVEEVGGKQIASIRSKGTIDMSKLLEAAAKVNPMVAAMKASGEGTIDMVANIDLATGQTVGGGGDINMVMNMTMPDDKSSQAQMNIKVDTHMKATINVLTEAEYLAATKPVVKPTVKSAPKPTPKPAPKQAPKAKPTVKKSK